jgi:hypothetical protein
LKATRDVLKVRPRSMAKKTKMSKVQLINRITREAADLAFRGQGFAPLDELPIPTYVTDADGVLIYFNRACVDFAGRVPALSHDRWCVTWRLHTLDGKPLPHDECPMAVALQRRRAVRGEAAVAERPDGLKSAFMPFPTPMFARSGDLMGAVNVFLDPQNGAAFLTDEALRYRVLAPLMDEGTAAILQELASEYEQKAQRLLTC